MKKLDGNILIAVERAKSYLGKVPSDDILADKVNITMARDFLVYAFAKTYNCAIPFEADWVEDTLGK